MGHEPPEGKEFIDLLDFSKQEPSAEPGPGEQGAMHTGEPSSGPATPPQRPHEKRLELKIGSRYLQTFSVILVSTAFVILGYYPSSYLPLGLQVVLMFAGGGLLLLFGDHLYNYDKDFQLYAKTLIFGGVKIGYTALWSLHFHYELVSLEFFSILALIMLVCHYILSFKYHSELLHISGILVCFIFATILHANGLAGDALYLVLLFAIMAGNMVLALGRGSPTVALFTSGFFYLWVLLHQSFSRDMVFNLSFESIGSRLLLVVLYTAGLGISLVLFAYYYHENSMLSMMTPKKGVLSKFKKLRILYAPLLLLMGLSSFVFFDDNEPFALLLFSSAIYGIMRTYFFREFGQGKEMTLFHISLFMGFLLTLFFYELRRVVDVGETSDVEGLLVPILGIAVFVTIGFLFYYDDSYWIRDFTALFKRSRELFRSPGKSGEGLGGAVGTGTGDETGRPIIEASSDVHVERSVRVFICVLFLVSGLLVGAGYDHFGMALAYHFSFLLLTALLFEAVEHIRQLSLVVVYGSYLFLLFSLTAAALLSPGNRFVSLFGVPVIFIYLIYSEVVKEGKDSRNLVFLALLWLGLSAFFLKEFVYPTYVVLMVVVAFLVLGSKNKKELFENLDVATLASFRASSSSSPSSPLTFPTHPAPGSISFPSDPGQEARSPGSSPPATPTPSSPPKRTPRDPSAESFLVWLNKRLRIYLYSVRKYNLLSFWNLGLFLLLVNGLLSFELYFKRGNTLSSQVSAPFSAVPGTIWDSLSLLLFLVLPVLIFLWSYVRYHGMRGRLVLPTLVLVFSLPAIFRYGFVLGPTLLYWCVVLLLFLYERHVHDETIISFLFLLQATALISEGLGITSLGLELLWLLLGVSFLLFFAFFRHFKHIFQGGLVVTVIFMLFSMVTGFRELSPLYSFVCFFSLFLFYLFVSPHARKVYPEIYQRHLKAHNPFEGFWQALQGQKALASHLRREQFELETGRELSVLFLLGLYFYGFIIVFSFLGFIQVWEAVAANNLFLAILVGNLLLQDKKSPVPRPSWGEAGQQVEQTFLYREEHFPRPVVEVGHENKMRKKAKRRFALSRFRQRFAMSYSEMVLFLSVAFLATGFMAFEVLRYYVLVMFSLVFCFFLWYQRRSEAELREFFVIAGLSLIYFNFLHSFVHGWYQLVDVYSIAFDLMVLALLFYYLLFATGYLQTRWRLEDRFGGIRQQLFHPQMEDYPWPLTLFMVLVLTLGSMSVAVALVPLLIFLYSLLKRDFVSFSVSYILLLFVSFFLATEYLNFALFHAKLLLVFLFFFLLLIGIINELAISQEPITFASGFVSSCLMIAVVFLFSDSIFTTVVWVLFWGTAFSAGLHLNKKYLRISGLFYLFFGLVKILYDLNKIGWERTVLALLLFGVMGLVSSYFYIKQGVKEEEV